jgi:hypothetical protein
VPEAPIACTLGADVMPARLAEWRNLGTHVLDHSDTDDGVALRFDDTVSAGEIADLAARERKCCAFFSFTIRITGDGTTLEVGAPDGARSLIDALVDQEQ